MANADYTIASGDRSDNSAFAVPGDEDGGAGDDSFEVEDQFDGKRRHTYVHIDNGWDVDVDVTLQGSHHKDSAMSSAVDDGSAETVSAGSVGAFDSDVGFTFAQINVNPAGTPTSGDLTITFQSREN